MALKNMAVDQKKKKQFVPADNPIEQLKDLGAGAVREVASVPAGILDTALEQIGLKPQKQPLSGEFQLAGAHRTNEKIDQKDASIEVKLHQLQSVQRNEKEVFNAKNKMVQEQISRLMAELAMEVKKLEQQTSEITSEVRKISVESRPSQGGIYHLNFFEQVIAMLSDLRKRVGESRMWLNAWSNKKKQKGYWAMFKKHGTSFAMSEERAIASANG